VRQEGGKMNFFQHRKKIGENIATFIRLKGFSKSSFSKLTNISRPTLNLILAGEISSPVTFETHLKKITAAFNLPEDYFLHPPVIIPESWQRPAMQYSDRLQEENRPEHIQKILNDLDDLLDIAAIYL
jgi:transcriptional regulator with XRE-family HTH domain